MRLLYGRHRALGKKAQKVPTGSEQGLDHGCCNVDRLSLKEINDLEAKIAKAKAAAREKAKSDLKDRIDRLVEGSGFTVAELYGFAARGRGRSKSAASMPIRRIRAKLDGSRPANRTGWWRV